MRARPPRRRPDRANGFGEPEQLLVRLGEQLPVVAVLGEFVGDLGVIELLDDVADLLGLRLELLVLVDDALGRGPVVPEVRGVHLLLERISPEDLVFLVNESRGLLSSAPRGR